MISNSTLNTFFVNVEKESAALVSGTLFFSGGKNEVFLSSSLNNKAKMTGLRFRFTFREVGTGSLAG